MIGKILHFLRQVLAKLLTIPTRIFGSRNERLLKQYGRTVDRINALEPDLARLSDAFTMSLNGAYTDTQLEDDMPPESGGLKGDPLPFTPEWSLGLNADYEWAVGAQSTAYVGGALRWLSDQTGTYDIAYRLENGRQREVPSYEVLDLQAGVDFGRYTIELPLESRPDEIVGALTAGGASVISLNPIRESLEDFFVKQVSDANAGATHADARFEGVRARR